MTRARDVANLIGSGNYSSTTFTATAGQTVFSIAHTQNFVQVFMNGLLLDLTVDYTSNGSAVTLTSGAAAGDEIEVVAYNTFSVGDALNQAAADTRYVNTTGDTMTGNLGIGVSPTDSFGFTKALDVGSTGGAFVYVRDTDATNAIGGIGMSGTRMYISNKAAGPMTFQVNGDATTRMTIDSSGRVTMPNQPSFGVYRNAGAVTANNVYVFNGYDYNTGTMYNTNNGRATAPVAGRYFLSTWMMRETNQEYTNYNYHIRKNGSTYKSVYSSNGGSGRHMQWSWAGTIGLAANDYIDIFTNNIRLYGSSHLYSAFCMHLLS